ncbi:RDD family protein [Nocardioides zeae]|uniref:RDD family protein n=1 Tax=Nocardioides imazamoxiresistens TaxID=3231893 RepID=A0ABU3PT60_9ACTN|nr:RDD family protein [Nocardioides zeae]MDT9592411.1 RDD family protein [Nocardioides zeae]
MSFQQPPGGHGAANPGSYGSTGPRPAELGDRFVARLIDGLVVGVPTIILAVIVNAVVNVVLPRFVEGYVNGVVQAALLTGAYVAYNYFFETSSGQTIGKSVMRLKVVGPGGGTVTGAQSVRRNAFYAAALLVAVPFLGGFLSTVAQVAAVVAIAVTIQKDPALRQGWHDRFASETYVSKI